MKYFVVGLITIGWFLTTIILALSFIGMFTFFVEDKNDEVYWFTLGRKLINELCC